MANIKKSFNFRSGIQVDDDNFIVNANGLVGIGSTIPTEILDVTGNVKIRGTLISDNIDISKLSPNLINVGVTSIKSGIISATSSSGIVTYYGDGSKLQGLPTSQWIDVDPSLNGYESIYSAGNVGIATTNPSFDFQVGGSPIVHSSGIGINSSGDVYTAGIITATSFTGSGSSIANINASNISSGTISTARFPQNISVGGIITATSFSGSGSGLTNLNASNISSGTISTARFPDNIRISGVITATSFVGNLVGIASTSRNLTSDANITIKSINSDFASIGIATINNDLLVSKNSYFSGLTTVNNNLQVNGNITFTGNITGNLGITTLARLGIATNTISNNSYDFFVGGDPLFRPGVAITSGGTIKASGKIDANEISISTKISTQDIYASGIITANAGIVGNLTGTATTATNVSGNGNVNAFSVIANSINVGIVSVSSEIIGDLTGTATTATNAVGGIADVTFLNVSGISSFQNELTPYTDKSSSIGTFGRSFQRAFINEITVGYAASNRIDTRIGNLVLASNSGLVYINNNFEVGGNTTFNGELNFNGNIDFGSNNLFIDTINNRVGIGTSQPQQKLSVVGNTKIDGQLDLTNLLSVKSSGKDAILIDPNTETIIVKNLSVTGTAIGVTAIGVALTVKSTNSQGFIQSYTATSLNFLEEFKLTEVGVNSITVGLSSFIGIGSTNSFVAIGTNIFDGNAKLYVAGDTYNTGSIDVDGSISSDGLILSTEGFNSGVGTGVKIFTDDQNKIISFNSTGIGTIYIPIPNPPNNIVFLESLWSSVDNGSFSNVSKVGIGTTNPTSTLTVSGDVNTTGITTSENGFTSGIGTAVKITTVGNKIVFTVPGVGSTSLTLYP